MISAFRVRLAASSELLNHVSKKWEVLTYNWSIGASHIRVIHLVTA